MVFHWGLSESKSPHVSCPLLSILADLNDTVVWMVSARPLIFNFASPFSKHSGIFPRAPITTGINVIFIFHSFFFFFFFLSLLRSKYSFLFSFSLIFFVVCWKSKVQIQVKFARLILQDGF